ncbi:Ppx/GppA family phosphatase [Metasolibacillus meyeri]|uniref:Ppx/GppA family phosphatase n=1 Tax=Metasolibacillus meyeri TaxID=1071052 RepID=UPI000D3051B8|nr:Ppx/GppA family phosphatase [Metasolibacillus meyeri]
MKDMRTAIIDIGSNTVRLVMYRYSKDEGLREFGNMKKVARLRTYILPNGEMSEEGVQLLQDLLQSFKQILEDYNIKDLKIAATAAVRQATNNAEIVQRMQEQLGMTIDILTEEEEAYFGFLAVVNSMATPSAVTIDIGGGSTEITLFKNKKLLKTHSFPFGTVSLKQNYVNNTIITENEKKQLRSFLREQFMSLPWIVDVGLPVIGIGGSARNIGQVYQQKIGYPISDVHHYELTKQNIDTLKLELGSMTFEQLKQLDGLSADRADIIVLALEAFAALMDVAGSKHFQLSKKGLREGLIINRIAGNNTAVFDKYDVFNINARRIAFEYGRSEEEVQTLSSLAEQLYREACLLELFDYNEAHLELLTRAAKLYAIGEYIELDSVSQHTFYLIANQSIPGITQIERIKIALLASYKNKEYFERFVQPFTEWFSKDEQKVLRDFGALLKFVYGLNISRRNIVSKVTLEKIEEEVVAIVTTKRSAVAEEYQANRQKKHLERLFKCNLMIKFEVEGWNK